MQSSKALKQKKCRACKDQFTPFNSLHIACSPACALQIATDKTQKRYRKEAREYRQVNKPQKSLLTEAQKAFNAYIRIRDHRNPCMSCESWKEQTSLTGQAMDAGHWHGVGAHPSLRFTAWNNHIQCVNCNRDLSGNPQNYRLGLMKRFSREWVEKRELQVQQKQPNHYSKDDLRRIKKIFAAKTRLYKRLFRS